MKINEYASSLTIREGGAKSVDVAQVSEILKLINKDLWGIPYFLIGLKKKKAAVAASVAAAVLFLIASTGCATVKKCSVEKPVAQIRVATHQQNRGFVNL